MGISNSRPWIEILLFRSLAAFFQPAGFHISRAVGIHPPERRIIFRPFPLNKKELQPLADIL
jgi:hypothetical protein